MTANRSRLLPTLSSSLMVLCAATVACRASAPGPEAAPPSAASRIISEALTNGHAYQRLAELCRVAPHRLSGSPGAQRAVEWAKAAMEAEGLENVRLEPCTVPHWERGSIERLSWIEEDTRVPVLALGGSVPTPVGGIEADVLVVTSFEELAERAEEARGKIVLFNRPMDESLRNTFPAYGGAVSQRSNGAVEAARVGAVAALVRSMTTLSDDNPHTGALRYRDGVERIPSAAVSTNAADLMAAALAGGETVRVWLELDCRWFEDAPSFNVVGELVGHELPDEVVVVGGHLDAWDVGEGAHDDGAGCVQAMEAARLLAALDLRPRRTIRVVFFMNEENGLAGGRAYYEAHADEMDDHVLAIESDRGGFTPRGFTTDARGAGLARLREHAFSLKEIGAELVLEGGGGADIGPMAQSGVPLVGYLPDPQRYFDLHHSPGDTFDKINERELTLGAAAIAVLAHSVADDPRNFPRN